MIEEVLVVQPEEGSEVTEGSYAETRSTLIRLLIVVAEQNVPNRRCLSLALSNDATRTTMLEERM